MEPTMTIHLSRESKTPSMMNSVSLLGLLLLAAPLGAQPAAKAANNGAPPDFSGVYYPIMRGLGGGGRGGAPPPAGERQGPPPKPRASAPLADGSQGRSPNDPSLTPEYMAKWEVMRKARMAGSSEYDNSAKCLPPGMPS